jgi:tetratricopeptide (TPR) repeat protein
MQVATVVVVIIAVAYFALTSFVESKSSFVADKMGEADGAFSHNPEQAVALYRETINAASVWPIPLVRSCFNYLGGRFGPGWPIQSMFTNELAKANQKAAQALERLDKYDEAIRHAKASLEFDAANEGVLKQLAILLSAGNHRQINEALRFAKTLDEVSGHSSIARAIFTAVQEQLEMSALTHQHLHLKAPTVADDDGSFSCDNDNSCSHNGKCIEAVCVCDPFWAGEKPTWSMDNMTVHQLEHA